MDYKPHTNVVGKKAARIVQLKTLLAVSDIIMETAGPMGSTTMIVKNDGTYPSYTKDGKHALDHIHVYGSIENGIMDQLKQITQSIVGRVGDGTSTAIRLCYLIFKELIDLESRPDLDMNPYEIIKYFRKATEIIIKKIEEAGRELSVEDIHDICMISTNSNEELSSIISDIYVKHGTQVYIDLKTSNTPDYITKEYDGLTINKGYSSPAYINRNDGTCELRDPKIYVFRDPIDSPELIGLFTRIVYDNIMQPYSNFLEYSNIEKSLGNPNISQAAQQSYIKRMEELDKKMEMSPTVIMAPFISRDAATILETLEKIEYGYDKDEELRMRKPPIVIITNLSSNLDELGDVSTLCNCKLISKYIDDSVQQEDIRRGKAPTVETVSNFYGTAEQVIVYKDRTKFINPVDMFEKDGEEYVLDDDGNRKHSVTYDSIVSFLKNELKTCIDEGESAVEINRLRRRLNGLVSSLVELYIGGISVTDRESLKDLADDAVRNCKSAVNTGVGRATSFEGLMASLASYPSADDKTKIFVDLIKDAYMSLIKELYSKSLPAGRVDAELQNSIQKWNKPINLKTLNYDSNVLTSIDTDITILDHISRIVTIMFTSNQILIESAFNNEYANIGSEEE